jgi:acetyltransferase-like isoleucine patch superfamily enzyme
MFERYNEKARRVIFFARYEAGQSGAPFIESEHLLLGILREDKALTNLSFGSRVSVEEIRKQVEANTAIREKVSTEVDLKLSKECKRILAYGAEEAERLRHKHIGPENLLLGILREKGSFAAAMLRERGVKLKEAREEFARMPDAAERRGGFRNPESSRISNELMKALGKGDKQIIEKLCARLEDLESSPPHEAVADGPSEAGIPDESAAEAPPRIDLYKIQSATPLKIKLLRGLWHCFQPPFFRHTPRMLSPLRIFLLRLFGANIGPDCHIGAGAKVWVPWNLKMGKRSSIGFDCEIYNFAPVEIGDQVVVSQRSYICTSTHDYTHPHFPLVSSPIVVQSQAWIAAQVFIAPGVTVGEGAVIGACSVVTTSMPPWQVCAGNPCKPIKPREVKPAE